MEKKRALRVGGFFCGVLNGFFGSGGGMVAVPLFKKQGLSPQKAHATSLFTTAVLSLGSVALSLYGQSDLWPKALPFLPGGVLGAILGAKLLKQMPSALLRKIFGGLLLFSGLRLLWGAFG